MGRGKKDSSAAGGSVDPVEEEEEEAAVMEVEEEEEVKGDEEEEWKAEEDEAEEEEEEWEQEEEEEADEASAEEQLSPPKLAEGFYEIETIRRRRRRREQLQYLVKWRGWPESANTWEPAENLRACSDFVDAFEKRQQPRSYGKRKRKRKISTTPVVSPNPSSHGRRGRPRRSDPRSLSQRPAPERKILPPRASSRRGTDNSNRNVAAQQMLGQGASLNVAAQQMLGQGATQEGSSNVLSVGLPSAVVHQQDEHQPLSGVSKVDSSVQGPPPQVGQVTGAKKRKLGSVKRYIQDEAQQEQGQALNGTSEKPVNQNADSAQGETGDRTKGEDGANCRITKIIKPVRYCATMTDDVQQVSITFRALRSDGQEVLVDDKELKSTNPLVLISYYEQHVRYSPTS